LQKGQATFQKKNVIAYLYADVLQKKAKCVMQGSHGLQNWTHRSSVAKLEVCQLINRLSGTKISMYLCLLFFFIFLHSAEWLLSLDSEWARGHDLVTSSQSWKAIIN